MISAITRKGKRITIDQQDVLGVGGEATVVKVDNLAVKLYHKIDSAKIEKLSEFISSGTQFPKNVCAPLELIKDSQDKKVVGFAMNAIPRGYEVIQMLSSKKFRQAHPKFDFKYIIDSFIDIYRTTETIHKNAVVGDFNDLNISFSNRSPVSMFMDVDSYQIGRYPCPVGTEAYLDPNLYNVDLNKKCYFSELTDWYSYWAMFIKSLIMAHPYGGVHNIHRNIPQRALNKVTFFDSAVKYPKAALSLDLLDDTLKSITERIFGKGERFKPSIDVISEFRNKLVECRSCKQMHPAEKTSCPACSTVNTQQIQRKVNVVTSPGQRTVTCEKLCSTTGHFVWYKAFEDHLWAIAIVGNKYVLYIYNSTGTSSFEILEFNNNNPKFDCFGDRYLVISTDSLSDDILIYDTIGKTCHKIASRLCGLFGDKRMFACSKNHLFRIQNACLYRGKFDIRLNQYIEDKLCSIMENQTWFAASPVNDSLFIIQRFFNNLSFSVFDFTSKNFKNIKVNMPELEDHESILSTSTRFTESYILFVIKTEIKGKTYTRVYVIQQETGKITTNYRVDALSSDTHRNIHGKAFAKPSGMHGIILHATDDGVVQEVIGQDRIEKQMLMSETEPFINESDSLLQYRKGILIVNDKEINYITLT